MHDFVAFARRAVRDIEDSPYSWPVVPDWDYGEPVPQWHRMKKFPYRYLLCWRRIHTVLNVSKLETILCSCVTIAYMTHMLQDDGGVRELASLSQSGVVIEGIKQMLVSGELQRGDRLPIEKDLANRLGVSRGSLREGVRALVAMGVLETRQGAGTYVTRLDAHLLISPIGFVVDLHDAQGVRQIQHVRRVLESEAARNAAQKMTESEILAARAVLDRFATKSNEADDDGLHHLSMEVDVEFHRLIARASGNQVLEALIEALASRTVRARLWRAINEAGAMQRSHYEHVTILDAIQRGDSYEAGILNGRAFDFSYATPGRT